MHRQRFFPPHWLSLLLLLAALGSPGAASAQGEQGAAAEQGVFVDEVNVSLVNIDVYVTDKKGNRVTGLTKNDFELLENGRPVVISHFSVVEGGRVSRDGVEVIPKLEVTELPEDPLDRLEASRELNREPVDLVPDDQRLHLVVYVDNYNIQPFNRNRVLRELRDFLRTHLDSQDRMMLVTYDREIHVRRAWTSEPEQIASALQELEVMTGSAVHRESDRRDALERIEESESYQGAVGFARTYASNIYNDLSFSLDALRSMLNGLAGLPGRKAILYVSEGLPMIAGEDLFHAVQQKFRDQSSLTDAFEFDASRRFEELAAAANADRVTFYTIDAGGLRTFSYSDASHQTAGLPGQGAFIEQVYISNLQSPLLLLAEETGGKAIINANRVTKSLETVAEDFNNYYSLGYSPAHYGDGRYYRLKVRLKNEKGLEIRHREGYRDKASSVRMSDGTLATLLHNFETNPLQVKLEFGAPISDERGRFMVPVQVSIPLGHIVLVPGESTHEARLRVYVAAMSENGDTSEIQESPLRISIPSTEVEAARGKYWLYSMNLLMRGGPHRVAVGVRDEVGADASFVAGQLVVGN